MIQAKNLSKIYGSGTRKVLAVKNLNLQIEKGEIFGLLGPDGSGKTTTIQMLCGILTPTTGSVSIDGVDIGSSPDSLGSAIGYMSEGFSLYGDLTVEENLDFFAELYRVSGAEAATRKEQLLRFARLEPARNRRARNLSGGMKKKLALACTLIYRPRVLFLDEPTTGVDPVSRQDLWKILYEFLAEGITIFVSTPYMDEAERCHRVALLREGEILASAAPAQLKETISAVTVELWARPQKRAVSVLRQMEGVSQLQVFGERLHILLRQDSQNAGELANQLRVSGVEIREFKTTNPSLEDVFIAAVQDGAKPSPAAALWSQKTGDLNSPAPESSGLESDQIAVSAQNLTRRFGELTAVRNLHFNVRRGEIFGFLGPNGSGKTTTIRMLTGLLPPSAGTATVAGYDIRTEQQELRARIGYMSQKFSLYDDLTVEENIQFYGDLYDLPRARLDRRRQWVLKMAGLRGKEGILAKDLSGGWKQRLALGCSILHEPQILFLDEPTSGVDPVSRREFWDLIFELSLQGVTVFVTTHYMDEAEHCHNLGLLHRGRLIARGSPDQLRKNMKLGSLLEVPVKDPLAALKPLEGQAEIIQTSIFGDRLHTLVWDPEKGCQVLERILEEQALMDGPIRPIPISLEDLFMLFIEMEEAGRRSNGMATGET